MSILKNPGLRALGTATVAACVLIACGDSGGGNGSLPLIRANLAVMVVTPSLIAVARPDWSTVAIV